MHLQNLAKGSFYFKDNYRQMKRETELLVEKKSHLFPSQETIFGTFCPALAGSPHTYKDGVPHGKERINSVLSSASRQGQGLCCKFYKDETELKLTTLVLGGFPCCFITTADIQNLVTAAKQTQIKPASLCR